MPGGSSNPVGTNGTLNAPGTGGITDAPFYGTAMQQFADPLHLFPSPTADNSAPSKLPNLGIDAKFYGGSFAPASGAGGRFNAMAQRIAGPRYMPGIPMAPSGMSMPMAGAAPQPGGLEPGGLAELIAKLRGNPNLVRT